MVNNIPHGDQLHECNATCPEYKNGPMPATVISHRHDDGRNCILGPDGEWRHWDHPTPEPGPRDVVDYVCLRSHPAGEERLVDLSSHPPSPLRTQDASEDYGDRGDFGMPGLGVSMRELEESWPVGTGSIFQVDGDRLVNKYDWPVTTINVEGVWYDYGEQGNHIEPATQQARRILGQHLPDVISHFLSRNAEYGEEAHVLGTKGQFADINRKVIKLKRYLWDDVPLQPGAEDIPTIAGELIGHLLILIDELDKEGRNGHGEA